MGATTCPVLVDLGFAPDVRMALAVIGTAVGYFDLAVSLGSLRYGEHQCDARAQDVLRSIWAVQDPIETVDPIFLPSSAQPLSWTHLARPSGGSASASGGRGILHPALARPSGGS